VIAKEANVLDSDQIDNWETVYDKNGLTVKLLDESAVGLYLEGVPYCEMTLQEWRAVNKALEGVE
jgi:hypothetical protein